MEGKTHFLILKYFQDLQSYAFQDSVQDFLMVRYGREQLFVLDNHSDQMLVDYGKAFISESEKLVVIVDEITGELKSLLPILNLCVKNKSKVRFLSYGSGVKVKPFMVAMKGRGFKDAEEIVQYLQQEGY